MKHGIYPGSGRSPEDPLFRFYWLDEELGMDEFNERIEKALSIANISKAETDLYEEILEAPLCETCKDIIEARKP